MEAASLPPAHTCSNSGSRRSRAQSAERKRKTLKRQYGALLSSPSLHFIKDPLLERQERSYSPLCLPFIHLQKSRSLKLYYSGIKFLLFVALLIMSSIFPRKDCVFTIDPSTARDLDDALSCKPVADGRMESSLPL